MLRLPTALLSLLLLLPACGYKPVEIPMDDPNLLSGHWTGALVQHRVMQTLFSTPDRVALVDGALLEVYDVHSGARLQALQLPVSAAYGYSALAYRDDGVIVALGDNDLLTYDPHSLALMSQRPLPENSRSEAWYLSRDGSVLSLGSNADRRFSTTTGALLPTAPSSNDHFQQNATSDDRWWVRTVPGAGKSTQQIVQSETGVAFSAGGQHAQVRNCTPTGDQVSVESVHGTGASEPLPDTERLLIAYPDGVLETRDTQGRLLSSVALTSCLPFEVYRLPGQASLLAFTSDAGGGLFDVQTGDVTERTPTEQTPTTGYRNVLLSGTLNLAPLPRTPDGDEDFAADFQPQYRFTPWNEPAWKLPNRTGALSLNVSTSRTGDKTGTVTGTAEMDGRTLTVSGNLSLTDAVLKAQGRAFSPSLTAALSLKGSDGTVSFLSLSNNLKIVSSDPPAYDPTVAPRYSMS